MNMRDRDSWQVCIVGEDGISYEFSVEYAEIWQARFLARVFACPHCLQGARLLLLRGDGELHCRRCCSQSTKASREHRTRHWTTGGGALCDALRRRALKYPQELPAEELTAELREIGVRALRLAQKEAGSVLDLIDTDRAGVSRAHTQAIHADLRPDGLLRGVSTSLEGPWGTR